MEQQPYEKNVRRPGLRFGIGFIDCVQSLIDACINDQQIVYGEAPLDKPVEPLTELDQRAYGTIVEE